MILGVEVCFYSTLWYLLSVIAFLLVLKFITLRISWGLVPNIGSIIIMDNCDTPLWGKSIIGINVRPCSLCYSYPVTHDCLHDTCGYTM